MITDIVDVEKHYPGKFDFTVNFEARFDKHENGGCSVYVPAVDTVFSAPSEEEAKRRCGLMVKSWINFWTEENNKGVVLKSMDGK